MTGLFAKLAGRLLRGRWGSVLPVVFKAAAEGQFGETVKKIYWFGAEYRTITGAALLGLGAALETICTAYPEMSWACHSATSVYAAGAFLASVGLVDGGVRAPWPTGTPKEEEK